jgi:hypothetical protein
MLSNYPPGMSLAISTDYEVPRTCQNGHVWTTPMYSELGGGFYVDENWGPVCPDENCGLEDVDDPQLAEERYAAAKQAGVRIRHVGPVAPPEPTFDCAEEDEQ